MKTIRLCLFAVCMLCPGCAMVERAPGMPRSGEEKAMARCEMMFIRQGSKWPCDGYLSIGLNWAKKSEYTDESGLKKRGLVAGLTLGFEPPENPELGKGEQIQVHVGQRVEWEGYSIYVEEIKVWPRLVEKLFNVRESIRLRVKPTGPPKTGEVPAPPTPLKALEKQ